MAGPVKVIKTGSSFINGTGAFVAEATGWLAARASESNVVFSLVPKSGNVFDDETGTLPAWGATGTTRKVFAGRGWRASDQWALPNPTGLAALNLPGDATARMVVHVQRRVSGRIFVIGDGTNTSGQRNFAVVFDGSSSRVLSFMEDGGSIRDLWFRLPETVEEGDIWYIEVVRSNNGDGTCDTEVRASRNGGDFTVCETHSSFGAPATNNGTSFTHGDPDKSTTTGYLYDVVLGAWSNQALCYLQVIERAVPFSESQTVLNQLLAETSSLLE